MLCLSMTAGLLVYALSFAPVSCHIHPPGEAMKEEPKDILGPYPSADACDAANATYFGGAGRCHCLFDFSAGTPAEPVSPTFPPPFGSLPENAP
jgi:hypothetical protein